MADKIDVHDLSDEQVEALEADFCRHLREKKKSKEIKGKKGAKRKEECPLAIWDSDVIGTLTREELYDDR